MFYAQSIAKDRIRPKLVGLNNPNRTQLLLLLFLLLLLLLLLLFALDTVSPVYSLQMGTVGKSLFLNVASVCE